MIRPEATPGTYALLVSLDKAIDLQVGQLGRIRFDSLFYMYFGSAFGPGGLGARLKHHLEPVIRPHWHIDYLRRAGEVQGIWYTRDPSRLECVWAKSATGLRDATPIAGFGSSDCYCPSHLVAVRRLPTAATFRRHLNRHRPGCARIQRLQIR